MKHLYVLAFQLICSYSFGQQSVNTSGGNVQSSQGSVSFSVGQVSTNYIENDAAMNEGVQQPYEFFHVLSIDKVDGAAFLEVFPNPTDGVIYLSSKDAIDAGIEIFDESGRLVLNEQRKNMLQTQVDLTAFSRGVYTVKVKGNTSAQIIRIIKN